MRPEHDLTGRPAGWAASFKLERDDTPRLAAGRRALLDFLGCAIGGSTPPPASIARGYAGTKGLLASALEIDQESAAFSNGVAAHSIELDDTHLASSLHPGVAVWPAALAVGETLDLSLREALEAAIVGYEATCRLGGCGRPDVIYARGFHPTAVCGAIGSALAVGKLHGLDDSALRDALGIAASQSSGLMAFVDDGSWTKPFHAGWAARSGIVAVELAKRGFRGPRRVLETRNGFLRAFADPERASQVEVQGLAMIETASKPHACCRYNQGAIDLAISFASRGIAPESIESIEVETVSPAMGIVVDPIEEKRRPLSVVDAQFSLPYAVGIGFAHQRAFLDQYREESLSDRRVLELAAKVTCRPATDLDELYPQRWPTRMTVRVDGEELTARTDDPKGDPGNPLSHAELVEKFSALAGPLSAGHERMSELVWSDLDDVSPGGS